MISLLPWCETWSLPTLVTVFFAPMKSTQTKEKRSVLPGLQPESNPQNTHGEMRDQTPTSYLLTQNSMCAPWSNKPPHSYTFFLKKCNFKEMMTLNQRFSSFYVLLFCIFLLMRKLRLFFYTLYSDYKFLFHSITFLYFGRFFA